MTTTTVNTAAVGTKLATGADTKITGLTISTPAGISDSTPLVLQDIAALPTSAAAAATPARTLYSATLQALSFVWAVKPTWTLPGSMTAPTFPQSLGAMSIPFSNGVFVRSCPAGMTFSLTTAP